MHLFLPYLFFIRPYKGVIAENLIRHLKTQVQQEHEQNQKQKYAKPRGRSLSRKSPKGFYDEFDDPGSWSDSPRSGKRFGCTVCDAVFRNKNVNKNSHSGFPIKAAMEKLLNASLNSSDTTCRHCESFDMERQSERRRRSGSEDRSHYISSTERTAHPSEPYLRGALWLGRNISMVIQQLAESLDTYWTKFLPQVLSFSFLSFFPSLSPLLFYSPRFPFFSFNFFFSPSFILLSSLLL